MVEYPFTEVEVLLTNGTIMKGKWLTATAAYITLKTGNSTYYIPYTSILYIKLAEDTKATEGGPIIEVSE